MVARKHKLFQKKVATDGNTADPTSAPIPPWEEYSNSTCNLTRSDCKDCEPPSYGREPQVMMNPVHESMQIPGGFVGWASNFKQGLQGYKFGHVQSVAESPADFEDNHLSITHFFQDLLLILQGAPDQRD